MWIDKQKYKCGRLPCLNVYSCDSLDYNYSSRVNSVSSTAASSVAFSVSNAVSSAAFSVSTEVSAAFSVSAAAASVDTGAYSSKQLLQAQQTAHNPAQQTPQHINKEQHIRIGSKIHDKIKKAKANLNGIELQ